MKIEVTAARKNITGFSLHDNLIAWMPRYAPFLAKISWLANMRDGVPGTARIFEIVDGFTSKRPLPKWRSDIYRPAESAGPDDGKDVILFADTFNTYFEYENLEAARDLLIAAGYRVLSPRPVEDKKRPLCCGRTFLTVGKIDQARKEAVRLVETYYPYAERGVPIIGLEPSCLLSLRDEIPSLIPGKKSAAVAREAVLFEEFCGQQEIKLEFKPIAPKVLVHGHCHQKAFNSTNFLKQTLKMVPGLEVEMIDSSCCGMAGAFGYGSETYETSMQMGELSLFPAVRKEPADTLIVADGASCRHQIEHGTNRKAVHVVRVLHQAMVKNR